MLPDIFHKLPSVFLKWRCQLFEIVNLFLKYLTTAKTAGIGKYSTVSERGHFMHHAADGKSDGSVKT